MGGSQNLAHSLDQMIEFSVDTMTSALVRVFVQIRRLCKHRVWVFTLMFISKFKRKYKIQKSNILF